MANSQLVNMLKTTLPGQTRFPANAEVVTRVQKHTRKTVVTETIRWATTEIRAQRGAFKFHGHHINYAVAHRGNGDALIHLDVYTRGHHVGGLTILYTPRDVTWFTTTIPSGATLAEQLFNYVVLCATYQMPFRDIA